MLRWIGTLCCLLWSLLWLSVAQATTLENVRYNPLPDKGQLVLDISHPTQFQQFSLPSPPRIVLDFPASTRTGRAGIVVNEGAIARLRTGFRDNDTLRVVIDLNYVAKANIYTLQPEGKRGHRIVVDVYEQRVDPALTLESLSGAQTPYVVFAGGPLKSSKQIHLTTQGSATAPTTVEVKPVALNSGRQVTASGQVLTQAPVPVKPVLPQRDIVVGIDPGHGGKDPGAVSLATGLYEKTVVLQIGKRLRDIVNAKPGFRAVMTRDNDTFIPLYRRMSIARKKGADIFVSIHADAVEIGKPKGSSVYILSTRGATSELAKYLAKSENAVDLRWGVDVSKYDDEVQQALLDIQQEATLESSHILAKQTISALGRVGKVHKSSVERANFVVLRSPDIPSMLVETAFISTPSEAKLLANPVYQQKLAQGIADGIAKYFEEHLPQHMLLGQ